MECWCQKWNVYQLVSKWDVYQLVSKCDVYQLVSEVGCLSVGVRSVMFISLC